MLTQLVTGVQAAIGSRHLPVHDRLVFVEYTRGTISAVDLLRPVAATISQGTKVIQGTWIFDCETGNLHGALGAPGDIWWRQITATRREMTPVGGAKIVNLGPVDYDTVTWASLQTLAYGADPIPGNDDATNQLIDGDVFAVLTNAGNYAKVQVLDYGRDMTVRWVTYRVGPAYRVLGTGYTHPEDIAVASDETTAYVTERSGSLLRVSLARANRGDATVVATGLTAPHQISLDEANGHAYVVEFAPAGRLLKIALSSGTATTMASHLENAVGLLVSADRQTAYVSEQAATGGRIVRIRLGTGTREVVASGLTDPFFMTWLDASEQRILVTERGAARRLRAVDLTRAGSLVQVATGLPTHPSSCAVASRGRLLVCCDVEIDALEIPGFVVQPAAPLLMGIGKVPFDRIVNGLANTTVDATYPYQFDHVPFGGTLPVLVNHQRAFAEGARYYRVLVDGVRRYDSWTDHRWKSSAARYVARTVAPVDLATGGGHYPVRTPAELFLWLSPALGSRVDTRGLSNSMHTIRIEFVDAAGTLVMSSDPLRILVNNERCTAMVAVPSLDGRTAEPICGTLMYPSKVGSVKMPFTARHPAGFATYSFTLVKGVNTLTPPSIHGPVASAPAEVTETVDKLLGTCKVAGFAEHVYVAATIIDGEVRQGQYDASAAIAFVLAPG